MLHPPSFSFEGDKDKAIALKAQARQLYDFVANQAELGGIGFFSRRFTLDDGSSFIIRTMKDEINQLRTGSIHIVATGALEEGKKYSYKIVAMANLNGNETIWDTNDGTLDNYLFTSNIRGFIGKHWVKTLHAADTIVWVNNFLAFQGVVYEHSDTITLCAQYTNSTLYIATLLSETAPPVPPFDTPTSDTRLSIYVVPTNKSISVINGQYKQYSILLGSDFITGNSPDYDSDLLAAFNGDCTELIVKDVYVYPGVVFRHAEKKWIFVNVDGVFSHTFSEFDTSIDNPIPFGSSPSSMVEPYGWLPPAIQWVPVNFPSDISTFDPRNLRVLETVEAPPEAILLDHFNPDPLSWAHIGEDYLHFLGYEYIPNVMCADFTRLFFYNSHTSVPLRFVSKAEFTIHSYIDGNGVEQRSYYFADTREAINGTITFDIHHSNGNTETKTFIGFGSGKSNFYMFRDSQGAASGRNGDWYSILNPIPNGIAMDVDTGLLGETTCIQTIPTTYVDSYIGSPLLAYWYIFREWYLDGAQEYPYAHRHYVMGNTKLMDMSIFNSPLSVGYNTTVSLHIHPSNSSSIGAFNSAREIGTYSGMTYKTPGYVQPTEMTSDFFTSTRAYDDIYFGIPNQYRIPEYHDPLPYTTQSYASATGINITSPETIFDYSVVEEIPTPPGFQVLSLSGMPLTDDTLQYCVRQDSVSPQAGIVFDIQDNVTQMVARFWHQGLSYSHTFSVDPELNNSFGMFSTSPTSTEGMQFAYSSAGRINSSTLTIYSGVNGAINYDLFGSPYTVKPFLRFLG